ncbi:hypothetical protein PSACC_02832 [Paramicrosporidium saccamoebae]|uniref:Uncharacterized protein n=1 Tax=Paramicrosporidium saccamoebae TaxID=1246581 RepID=A0A2H9TI47_9FUNG|nr:hypothetical protein PSACC_02832 [Paramicrosporidium saccamoebae]
MTSKPAPLLTIGQVVLDVFDSPVAMPLQESSVKQPAIGSEKLIERITTSQERAKCMNSGIIALKNDLSIARVQLTQLKPAIINQEDSSDLL